MRERENVESESKSICVRECVRECERERESSSERERESESQSVRYFFLELRVESE